MALLEAKHAFSSIIWEMNHLARRGLRNNLGMQQYWNRIYRLLNKDDIVETSFHGLRVKLYASDVATAPMLVSPFNRRYKYGFGKSIIDELTRILQPGMVFLDAGANVGIYSLIASRRVGDGGRVYAFEPDPKNCEIFRENVKLNRLMNVVVEEKALSDRPGFADLFKDDVNLGRHTLSEDFLKGLDGNGKIAGSSRVETIDLDSYAYDHGFMDSLSLMKLDVEGAEGLVLNGGTRTIIESRPKIIMEFTPEGLPMFGTDPWRLLDHLESLDYGMRLLPDYFFYKARDIHPSELGPTSVEGVGEFMNKYGLDQVDLLLEKKNMI